MNFACLRFVDSNSPSIKMAWVGSKDVVGAPLACRGCSSGSSCLHGGSVEIWWVFIVFCCPYQFILPSLMMVRWILLFLSLSLRFLSLLLPVLGDWPLNPWDISSSLRSHLTTHPLHSLSLFRPLLSLKLNLKMFFMLNAPRLLLSLLPLTPAFNQYLLSVDFSSSFNEGIGCCWVLF